MINKQGKSYKDVVAKYTGDYSVPYDPTYSGSVKKNDASASSVTVDVYDELTRLEEGQAGVIKTGEDATTMYYLVYKPKYSEIEDYLTTDSVTGSTTVGDIEIYDLKSGYSRYSLINDMKGDAFKDYLDNYAASLDIKKNETAIKGYKAKMFVSKDSDTE